MGRPLHNVQVFNVSTVLCQSVCKTLRHQCRSVDLGPNFGRSEVSWVRSVCTPCWYYLYMFEWSMMKTCTFILLFIYSSHVSNIVCLLNSNVKRGLLENYISRVTKLDISGLLTLHLYNHRSITRTIKPPCRRLEFCNLIDHSQSNKARPPTNHTTPEGPVQPCGPVRFSVAGYWLPRATAPLSPCAHGKQIIPCARY